MAHQFKGFRATRPVARLSDKKKNIWEAFFIVYTPQGGKIVSRIKVGINSRPPGERKAEAQETARALWEALQSGWNPIERKYPSFDLQPVFETVSFTRALQMALQEKLPRLSKYSAYDYKGAARFFLEAARVLGYADTPIEKIKRKDIRAILSEARRKRNWTAKARNKYLSLLRSLLSVASDDLELMEYNPATGIKDEAQDQTIGYKRVDADQKTRIAAHLQTAAPAFLEYLLFIYDDGIRRKETLLIQIKDIDLLRREIHIRPEVSKTRIARTVPITDTLLRVLDRRGVSTLPKNWYLFSSDRFNPGPAAYHPNTPTNWWRKLVQTDLGIDCKMYSLKHTGGDDKIKAGIPLEALRDLYGHRSSQMTHRYVSVIKDQYRQQIIDKAPVFGK